MDCALQGVDLYWYHRAAFKCFFRTCARAGTSAGVSRRASHNEEGRRLDLFYSRDSCVHADCFWMCASSQKTPLRPSASNTALGQWEPRKKCLKLKKKKKESLCCLSAIFSQPSHNFTTSCVGVGSLEAWWFGQSGGWRGDMFSLHELPANPLIKHANGCNCCWW